MSAVAPSAEVVYAVVRSEAAGAFSLASAGPRGSTKTKNENEITYVFVELYSYYLPRGLQNPNPV